MAPSSAYRLSTMIWSCILLISLLVATAGSTTVTKTHITTTQITVNEQHGLHAMASAPESPGPIASYKSLEEETPPNVNLDLNKRAAQNAASTATNLGVTYTVGTHLIPFTGGETKSIDGTLYSLDTGSHSLYFLLPISPTSSGSAGAGGASGSSSGSSMTLVSTATPTGTLGQTAVGVSTSGSSSSTGASSSGSQSKSSTASVNPTVNTAGTSGPTSVKGTTSDTLGKSSSGSSSQGTSLTSSSSLVGQTIGTNQTAASMTSDTTSSKLPSGSSSQGTSLTSSSSLGQSIGTNRTATTSTTSSSVSHSDTSTHTSNSSGLSASSSLSATSSSKSSSLTSKVIPGETLQSIAGSNQTVASSASTSTTRGTSMIGTQSTGLNNSTASLSTSSSASASNTQVTTSPSALNTTSSISSTKLSTSNTALINSTTTDINTASSRSSTTSGVTVSTSSRSGGNQTTSTGSKPSTLVNGTSTSTISRTRSSQTSAQVVTTFVSIITAVNISDASGSQTSTKVVTTVVSTLTGLSTDSTDTSSSDSLSPSETTSSGDGTMSMSSTGDGTLTTPLPLSSTASDEPLQEVTLMTGRWDEEVMEMSCKPPCTMTLPPVPLNTPATLRYPPAITSVCTNVGSQVYRYAITVSVDPVTITELALLPVSVGAMSGSQPAVTSEINFSLPQGSCSMALPSGDVCAKRPMDSTNGTCGPQVGLGCPDMQCCGPQGTCGTGSSKCVVANGCNHDFGPCWLPGESSFRPLSEVFAPATETSACPIALLPGPSDGPEIAQPPDTTDSVLPPPGQTSTDGQTVPVPIPVPTPRPGGPPKPPKPRLCFLCGKIKIPKWKLDLSCRGPLCKHIGPRRGCLGICDLFKCHVGCGKKGGGDITKADKPKPDPEDPPGPGPDPDDELEETETVSTSASRTQSSSSSSETESECETTMTATQVTAMCNIFTEVVGINMGNDTTLSAPQTTCTSTKRRITQGCEVTGTTTTVFDSCTKTQTATEITKFCTESISAGVTYTPCTRTASTVFEGCSVTATTTSVIDDVCQAQVTLAPDDPQGEFGTLPANSSNETCPYFPGVKVTVLDDQGADGQSNDTCPMPNGTRTSFDDDQGDDEPKSSCNLNNGTTLDSAPSCPLSNATLIQGPDGAEDGNVTASCPINSTIAYEPDGALDSDSAPLCNSTSPDFNMTMEQELGQGEDGLKQSNSSCPMKGNSTLEVDNDQGEDRPPGEEDSCPVIPDGIILSPLADLGDYAPANASDECPALDGRFPISWMDEQGDDWQPEFNSTTSTSPNKTSWTKSCSTPTNTAYGKCALVIPKTFEGSTASTWSCDCIRTTRGQVVTATVVCGTTMCPNWQTTSTRPTEIDTAPLFTFTDPSVSAAPSESAQLTSFEPARCKCSISTVSGERTCIRPSSCPNSDCIWPRNTAMGRCAYVQVSTLDLVNFHGKTPLAAVETANHLEPYPDIDYCVCEGQGSTMIDAMDGCNSIYSRICPNQVGVVTNTWPALTPGDCRSTRGLPRLPWFESCNLATGTFTTTIEGALQSSRVTFCTCNKVSETGHEASSYVLSTVSRECNGIYMCHNSVGFVQDKHEKPKAHKRIENERATTATAAGPVIAVTTDATPGSAPTTAAGPTILMAE